jgi:hypothetical protein
MKKETARTIPILEVCQALGLQNEKESGGNVYFKSPRISDQRTGSLSVHPQKAVWHDYATGESGDGISLVQYGTNTDFHGAMAWFDAHFSSFSENSLHVSNEKHSHQMVETHKKPPQTHINPHYSGNCGAATTTIQHDATETATAQHGIQILEVKELFSYPLKNYLASRGIPPELAAQYLKEVKYRNAGKEFYAIGFSNDAGGYELRSASFKGAIAPKEVSFIHGSISGPKKLNVFEGFIDFLSAMVYFKTDRPTWDTVILNSTSMVNHVKALLPFYKTVNCFLDADTAGVATLTKLKAISSSVVDRSMIYSSATTADGKQIKDFNEFLLATNCN